MEAALVGRMESEILMGKLAPFYADSVAITAEHLRHHIVVKQRHEATQTWAVTCSCGASTGEGEHDTVLRLWDAHYQEKLRNP